jgi:hypothetical protein
MTVVEFLRRHPEFQEHATPELIQVKINDVLAEVEHGPLRDNPEYIAVKTAELLALAPEGVEAGFADQERTSRYTVRVEELTNRAAYDIIR